MCVHVCGRGFANRLTLQGAPMAGVGGGSCPPRSESKPCWLRWQQGDPGWEAEGPRETAVGECQWVGERGISCSRDGGRGL